MTIIEKHKGKVIKKVSNTGVPKEEYNALTNQVAELNNQVNNGKQLIADAIGAPLNAENTFSAMSDDIINLLYTFRTNMANSGITVEGGDTFKQLIDKIAIMAEESKSIRYKSGAYSLGEIIPFSEYSWDEYDSWYDCDYQSIKIPKDFDMNFIYVYTDYNYPAIIYPDDGGEVDCIVYVSDCVLYDPLLQTLGGEPYVFSHSMYTVCYADTNDYYYGGNWSTYVRLIEENDHVSLPLIGSYCGFAHDVSTGEITFNAYYAVGFGEEDATLRNSLADILQDKGVNVTEEDSMASLINKVDEEFDRQNTEVDNGKELIASAVGTPVSAEDTYQGINDDINELLLKFKTNLLIYGTKSASTDKLLALINKIPSLGGISKKINIEIVSSLPDTGATEKLYIVSDKTLDVLFTEQLPSVLNEDKIYITYKTYDSSDFFCGAVCSSLVSITGGYRQVSGALKSLDIYLYSTDNYYVKLGTTRNHILSSLDFNAANNPGKLPANRVDWGYYKNYSYREYGLNSSAISTFTDNGTTLNFSVRALSWTCQVDNIIEQNIGYSFEFSHWEDGRSSSTCGIVSKTAIDLTNVNNVRVNVSALTTTSSYEMYIGLMSSSTAPTGQGSFVQYQSITSTGNKFFDTISLSGSYYLGVYMRENSNGILSATINDVVIEESPK